MDSDAGCPSCTTGNSAFEEHSPSCIHRLPSELTSRIFASCLETLPINFPRDRTKLSTKKNVFIRLLLGSICRRWRNIAISTLELWALVDLHHARLPPVDVLNEWIRRSGSLPLYVSISCGWIRFPSQCHSMPDILTTLGPTIPRWETLHFYGTLDVLRHLRHSISNKSTSILKNISLNICDVPLELSGLDFGSIRPSPSSVRIHYCLPSISQYVKLDWSNVTYLDLIRTTIQNILAILALTPRLRTFILRDSLYLQPRSESYFTDFIVLPHLTNFTLLEGRRTILEYITLPSLRLFEFGNIEASTMTSVQDAVLRWGCPLDTLEIVAIDLAYIGCISKILKLAPTTLTHLEVRDCHNAFLFLAFLFEIDGDREDDSFITLRLPNLRTLRLGSRIRRELVDVYLAKYRDRITAIAPFIPGEESICAYFDLEITVRLSISDRFDVEDEDDGMENLNMQCLDHIAHLERNGVHVIVEKPDDTDCIVSSMRALGLSS